MQNSNRNFDPLEDNIWYQKLPDLYLWSRLLINHVDVAQWSTLTWLSNLKLSAQKDTSDMNADLLSQQTCAVYNPEMQPRDKNNEITALQ